MERILLVDDEPIFRMGLRSVISWEELGCQIVGEAKNGEEALLQIEEKGRILFFWILRCLKWMESRCWKNEEDMKKIPGLSCSVVLMSMNTFGKP